MRRLPLMFVGALLVTACAGSSDDSGSGTTPVDTAAATAAPDTETPSTDVSTTDVSTTDVSTTESATTETAVSDPPATDATPASSEPPATEGSASDLAAFEPIGDGPYPVGVSTITVTDAERNRPLTVDVWFPLTDEAQGDPHRYTFVTGDYYESPRAISASADLISSDGPFPLVVYTHGSGGTRYIDSDYTESLASHGYLVVAADHTGNTAVERIAETQDDPATIAYNRPRDIQVLIDAMTNPESAETAGFVGSVDPEQIAVTGHSLGGYGSYAIVSGMSNEAGTVEGDDRVDAIIPLAPALGDGNPDSSLLVADQLAAVDVPTLVMVGTDDKTTPPTPNVDRAVAETSSEVVYRVDLVAAEHQSFTDLCNYLEFFPQLENPTQIVLDVVADLGAEGCSDGDMPIERVQEIENTFAVTFLDSIFRGGEMITPDNTELPDDIIETVKES